MNKDELKFKGIMKLKEIDKAFKKMEDSMLHWDIVGNKLVKPSDKVLRQREKRHNENLGK